MGRFQYSVLGSGVCAAILAAGCATMPIMLRDAKPDGVNVTYASDVASRTLPVSVAYEPPDTELQTAISARGFMESPVTVGYFRSGEIVAREFGKVAYANFAKPSAEHRPSGRFSVVVNNLLVRKDRNGVVSAVVEATIALTGGTPAEKAYQKRFKVECSAPWPDESVVPQAVYDGVGKLVKEFLSDWNASGAAAALSRWHDGATPGLKQPELKSMVDLARQGDVYCGRCVVACNDYEGFRAKGWADAQIEQTCRRKLGIEPERIRIVHDVEVFDATEKTWSIEFRAFARARMVLSFNKATRHGYATGDLGLMGLSADKAAEELRRYVFAEMDVRAGMVTSDIRKGKAGIRFDDFTTDKTNNLITMGFRVVE